MVIKGLKESNNHLKEAKNLGCNAIIDKKGKRINIIDKNNV